MFASIFKNTEHRNILIIFMIILIMILAFCFIYISVQYQNLNILLRARDSYIVDIVSEKYPEFSDEIEYVLSKYPVEEKSSTIIRKEDVRFYIAADRLLYENMKKTLTGLLLFISVIFIILFIISSLPVLSIYNRLKQFTLHIEGIMTGRFNVLSGYEGEGTSAVLAYQLNMMSERLKHSFLQINKEKEYLKKMISLISHQFKTPVASLKLFNELMLEGVDNETRVDFLHRSIDELDKMDWLVNTLLRIARIEAGTVGINKRMLSINDTVNKTVESVKPISAAKNIKIEVTSKMNYIVLHDNTWIFEVMTNILTNAIKYTDEKGDINVRLYPTGNMLNIDVEDTGKGINPEHLPHIFEIFYRGDETDDRKGSGLGLALTKLIVEKHGGNISVKSQVGIGSVFTVSLPMFLSLKD